MKAFLSRAGDVNGRPRAAIAAGDRRYWSGMIASEEIAEFFAKLQELAEAEARAVLAESEPDLGVFQTFHASLTSNWQRNEWDGINHPYAALAESIERFVDQP